MNLKRIGRALLFPHTAIMILCCVGVAVSCIVVIMAFYMIVTGTKKLKEVENER